MEFNASVAAAISTVPTSSSSASSGENASSTGSAVTPLETEVETLPQLRAEQLDLASRDSEQIKREISLLEAERDKYALISYIVFIKNC